MALIVSARLESAQFFKEMLVEIGCEEIICATNCQAGRRLLLQRNFSICIINAPLPDETGFQLAEDAAQIMETQVILVVRNEQYGDIAENLEQMGVFAVSKPVSKQIFWSVLQYAKTASQKISKLQQENNKLKKQMDDLRIFHLAKCLLMQNMQITEHDAHRFIEKTAMDQRQTKRQIAQDIIEREWEKEV